MLCVTKCWRSPGKRSALIRMCLESLRRCTLNLVMCRTPFARMRVVWPQICWSSDAGTARPLGVASQPLLTLLLEIRPVQWSASSGAICQDHVACS
jgi:hypothetical protein